MNWSTLVEMNNCSKMCTTQPIRMNHLNLKWFKLEILFCCWNVRPNNWFSFRIKLLLFGSVVDAQVKLKVSPKEVWIKWCAGWKWSVSQNEFNGLISSLGEPYSEIGGCISFFSVVNFSVCLLLLRVLMLCIRCTNIRSIILTAIVNQLWKNRKLSKQQWQK